MVSLSASEKGAPFPFPDLVPHRAFDRLLSHLAFDDVSAVSPSIALRALAAGSKAILAAPQPPDDQPTQAFLWLSERRADRLSAALESRDAGAALGAVTTAGSDTESRLFRALAPAPVSVTVVASADEAARSTQMSYFAALKRVVGVEFRSGGGPPPPVDLASLTVFAPHLRTLRVEGVPLATCAGASKLTGLTELSVLSPGHPRMSFKPADWAWLDPLQSLATLTLQGAAAPGSNILGPEAAAVFSRLPSLRTLRLLPGEADTPQRWASSFPASKVFSGLTQVKFLQLPCLPGNSDAFSEGLSGMAALRGLIVEGGQPVDLGPGSKALLALQSLGPKLRSLSLDFAGDTAPVLSAAPSLRGLRVCDMPRGGRGGGGPIAALPPGLRSLAVEGPTRVAAEALSTAPLLRTLSVFAAPPDATASLLAALSAGSCPRIESITVESVPIGAAALSAFRPGPDGPTPHLKSISLPGTGVAKSDVPPALLPIVQWDEEAGSEEGGSDASEAEGAAAAAAGVGLGGALGALLGLLPGIELGVTVEGAARGEVGEEALQRMFAFLQGNPDHPLAARFMEVMEGGGDPEEGEKDIEESEEEEEEEGGEAEDIW